MINGQKFLINLQINLFTISVNFSKEMSQLFFSDRLIIDLIVCNS